MLITIRQALGQDRICQGCQIKLASHEPCVERNGKPYHVDCCPALLPHSEDQLLDLTYYERQIEMAIAIEGEGEEDPNRI